MALHEIMQEIKGLEQEAKVLRAALATLDRSLKRLHAELDDISGDRLVMHEIWYEDYREGKSFIYLQKKYGVNQGDIYRVFKSYGWLIRSKKNEGD